MQNHGNDHDQQLQRTLAAETLRRHENPHQHHRAQQCVVARDGRQVVERSTGRPGLGVGNLIHEVQAQGEVEEGSRVVQVGEDMPGNTHRQGHACSHKHSARQAPFQQERHHQAGDAQQTHHVLQQEGQARPQARALPAFAQTQVAGIQSCNCHGNLHIHPACVFEVGRRRKQ